MLLNWDEETYMSPGSVPVRSEQKALISSLIHEEHTSSAFEKHLASLIDLESGKVKQDSLDETQKAALREWRHDFLLKKKLPKSLIEEQSRLSSTGVEAWKKAKEESNFSLFAPELKKIVALCQKKAEHIGYEQHPYDALLQFFEPGMTVSRLDDLFGELRPALTDIVQKLGKREKPDRAFLTSSFCVDKVAALCRELMENVGLNPNTSRLDTSAHPFCMIGHPDVIRITIFKGSTDYYDTISALMHEAGHALYEQGLDKAYFGTPLCEAISFGIHESQSKFWECFVGNSLPFTKYVLPKIREIIPAIKDVTPEEYYHAINYVHPSMIRVSADEVTYSLHIILRYELEKALIDGSLAVEDIPAAWNAKMEEYLGIRPENDSEGCLQDVHWSGGWFGYFPSYALGNLYAAQWYDAITKEMPDFDKLVEKGEMHLMAEWLREKIHKEGRRYSAEELCKKVTGSPLSCKPFLHYLKEKYNVSS